MSIDRNKDNTFRLINVDNNENPMIKNPNQI